MLNDFNCACPVYIACGYTDLRRGIDGLAGLVKSEFDLDPYKYLTWALEEASRRPAAELVPWKYLITR